MPASNRGPELAAVTGLLLGLSAVTVSLRCYVRIFMLKVFRPEDWLAVWTLGTSIVYTIFVILSIKYGAGRHLNTVPDNDIPKVLKMRWAAQLTYIATGITLKLTVGMFILRICSKRWHKMTVCTTLIVCVGFNLFYLFMAVFQCRPATFFWEQYTNADAHGTCLPTGLITGLTYAACGVNAVGDWVLGLLPIVLVRDLNLAKRQKISVAGILALGALASTATIVRLFYVWQLTQGGDTLYEFTDFAIWSTVENGLGLTASSIATLRLLFKSFLDINLTQRLSMTRDALRKRSRGSFGFGPSPGPNAGGQIHAVELRPPSPPSPAASAESRRSSDGNERSGDSTPLIPGKYSWQSYNSYELNKDTLARHYYPVSPRVARTRWHSDGSPHYRTGGIPQRPKPSPYGMHGRQLSV